MHRVLRFFIVRDRRPTAGGRVSAHRQSPKWEGSYGSSASHGGARVRSSVAERGSPVQRARRVF